MALNLWAAISLLLRFAGFCPGGCESVGVAVGASVGQGQTRNIGRIADPSYSLGRRPSGRAATSGGLTHVLSFRGVCSAVIAVGLAAGLSGLPVGAASAAGTAPSPSQRDFADAATASGVPEPLLLALSYQVSRWDDHGTAPSASGGYGLMHLTDVSVADIDDARGLGEPPSAELIAGDESLHRLTAAARLVGAPADLVKADRALNITAGATLLADRARTLDSGALPDDLAGWYPAVAWYSGSTQASGANAFADDVYESLRSGITRTTNTGDLVILPPTAVPPIAKARLLETNAPAAECPAELNCRWIPAAYQWTNPANTNAYGNYDPADRPADGNKIRYIVIHDTEGPYAAAIASAQNPLTVVAAHYVIRSSDGEVTQMIRTKDIGWHAGNRNINSESIGIEHEGIAKEGATWYTEAMYRSSAALVKYLAARYRIPLDRTHIVGHDDVERSNPATLAGSHWDPGPFWDWDHYMSLLGAPVSERPGRVHPGDIVTISPDFATNKQSFPACSPKPCTAVSGQASNFVYLRTEPREDAPLISDPVLQPGGAPGTPNAEDWGNKAVTGRRYVVAETSREWIAIWYGGSEAWIFDPRHDRVLVSCDGRKIAPAEGLASIPVYGKAIPDPAEYPAGITPDIALPLQYRIPAGQQYVAGEPHRASDYYARFDGANVPLNHTLVRGTQVYLRISLAHRWGFVKLSDVTFVR
ncbi:MAG: hypothetical protein QOD41_3747 [Cryptosporangiaceae bacterium]|nr:hypothetical protein [Cryptosporangiaceae bacterium]